MTISTASRLSSVQLPSLAAVLAEKARRAEESKRAQFRTTLRSSLSDWDRYCGFEPALHHRLINRELEALERGDFFCLEISAPPGSAKTTYASHLFPPWYMARNPTHLVLSGSHTQDFARRKIG